MNEQRFDELFKDKLENFQEIPSPDALNKLDRKLDERKRGAWINFAKLAAVLIVIAISVYIVHDWGNDRPTQITEQTSDNSEQRSDNLKENLQSSSVIPEANDPNKLDETINQEPAAVVKQLSITKNEQAGSLNKEPEPIKISERINQDKPVQDISSPTLTLAKETPEVIVNEQIEPSEPQQNTPTKTEPAKITRSKVTITYKRSPAPPQPTLAMENQSNHQPKGIKKVWRKAVGSYGEISLAGIRGTKDQLLAFERKNKTKESKSN